MKAYMIAAVCIGAALSTEAMAVANPASVFCGTMGGRLVIAKLADGGEIGLCYLPGRKIVEEWTLFSMFDGKKPSPRHNPFS